LSLLLLMTMQMHTSIRILSKYTATKLHSINWSMQQCSYGDKILRM